jgi:phage/plasmid-like protein (TIGR03299 family)
MEIALNSAVANIENGNNNGTRIAMRTDAKPVMWRGIQGCENFSTPVTVNEAIEAVGANFEVTKQHLIRVPDTLVQSILNGEPSVGVTLTRDMIINSHMATVRTDRDITLGVVGSKYGVVQNSKAFEFINLLASGVQGSEKAVIETAGILGDGERMYVTAKLPSDIYLDDNGHDPINDYILFTNTHDGSGAVTVLFTPIRVVCQNTLNMALRTAQNKLVYKHTSNVNSRLEWSEEENLRHAIDIISRHRKFKESFKESLFNLKNEKVTDTDIMRFASNIILGDNKHEEKKELEQANYNLDSAKLISNTIKNRINILRDTIESGIGQDMYRGSKLWLLNGLTTFFSNEKKYKSNEDKYNSIIEGTDANKLNNAYKLLAA